MSRSNALIDEIATMSDPIGDARRAMTTPPARVVSPRQRELRKRVLEADKTHGDLTFHDHDCDEDGEFQHSVSLSFDFALDHNGANAAEVMDAIDAVADDLVQKHIDLNADMKLTLVDADDVEIEDVKFFIHDRGLCVQFDIEATVGGYMERN